jgi:hypothetical protein
MMQKVTHLDTKDLFLTSCLAEKKLVPIEAYEI